MNTAGRKCNLPEWRILALCFVLPLCCMGSDWPQYRGGNHDGVSGDRITKQWTGAVTNPVWKVSASNGLCSVAVAGGRLFTQMWRTIGGARKEVCLTLSATNGTELWASALDDALYPNGGVGFDDGPRTTPAVEGNAVFVLTSYLKLYRLNAVTGETNWLKDLRTLFGSSVIAWQNAASPVVENGLIYLNANCGTSTLMAFRVQDGTVVWRSQDEAMTHSTPLICTINGVRQVIFATQSGLVSLNPQTGDRLWKFSYPFTYSTSIGVSPVVYENMVFVSGAHAYGMRSVVMQANLSGGLWTTSQLWSTNNPASHWMTPVAHQGFLYGQFGIQSFDSPSAQLKCIEMRTGNVKWSVDGFGRSGTILVDDHIVSLTELGDLVLVKPNTNAYTPLVRFLANANYNQFSNRCWNMPAVADGKIYVRSTAFATCFDFSMPDLKLDPPKVSAPNRLDLIVRTVTGKSISSNRVGAIEVRSTPDVAQQVNAWTKVTNSSVLTNGVVRIPGIEADAPRFFIVTEPK